MKLYIFDKVMAIHRFFGLPAATLGHRRHLKQLLMNTPGNLSIFEYGTGYSTVYYPKFLDKHNRSYQWYSVDNTSSWHSKFKKLVNKNVHLKLFEFTPWYEKTNQDTHRTKQEEQYINSPGDYKYDIILIDGRFRRRCLEVARKCIKPGGTIVVYEAQRNHYKLDASKGEFINCGKFYPLQKQEFLIYVEKN